MPESRWFWFLALALSILGVAIGLGALAAADPYISHPIHPIWRFLNHDAPLAKRAFGLVILIGSSIATIVSIAGLIRNGKAGGHRG